MYANSLSTASSSSFHIHNTHFNLYYTTFSYLSNNLNYFPIAFSVSDAFSDVTVMSSDH